MAATVTLSVKDEIAIMRRRWPEFRVTGACRHHVTWRGVLRPFRKSYEVRIAYGPYPWIGDFRLMNRSPRIELVTPKIVLLHPRTGELVPHVFDRHVGPYSPLLCVYDPFADEWDQGIAPLADTIVPWTAQWLACYELWLTTGKWTGGGRHPGEGDYGDAEPPAMPGFVADAVGQRRRIARVAALTGTHACRGLLDMAVENQEEGVTLNDAPVVHFGDNENQPPAMQVHDAA